MIPSAASHFQPWEPGLWFCGRQHEGWNLPAWLSLGNLDPNWGSNRECSLRPPGESGAKGGEALTKRAPSKCHLSLFCTQKVLSVLYQSPHLIITSSGREVLFLGEDTPSWRAYPSAISSSSHRWHLLSAVWVTELRILPAFSQQSYQLSTIAIPIFGLELQA